MTDETSVEEPIPPLQPEHDIDLRDLVSEWQFAQFRVLKLWPRKDLRRECLVTLVLLAVVFAVPAISWIRVWTLPGSLQLYALFAIPLVVFWSWLARLRLAVPEVLPIRALLREKRRKRVSPMEIGEREMSVIRYLVEETPVKDPRSSWLLIAALLFDLFAFWTGEPMLTCLGFTFTCVGLVLYRHGRYALRSVVAPFFLLLLMTPISSPIADLTTDRLPMASLNVVEHMVRNGGAQADIPLEGSPVKVTANGHVYSLYAQRSGTGIPEALVVLFSTLFFLSIVRTSNIVPKIGTFVSAVLITTVIVIARMVLLCLLSVYDKDIALLLETASRLFIIPFGGIVIYSVARGLGCKKYHRWVAISREF